MDELRLVIPRVAGRDGLGWREVVQQSTSDVWEFPADHWLKQTRLCSPVLSELFITQLGSARSRHIPIGKNRKGNFVESVLSSLIYCFSLNETNKTFLFFFWKKTINRLSLSQRSFERGIQRKGTSHPLTISNISTVPEHLLFVHTTSVRKQMISNVFQDLKRKSGSPVYAQLGRLCIGWSWNDWTFLPPKLWIPVNPGSQELENKTLQNTQASASNGRTRSAFTHGSLRIFYVILLHFSPFF